MSKTPDIFSDHTRVSGPITRWLALLGIAAVIGGSWFMLKAEVSQNTRDIEDLRRDARADREVLIRIDENVKALKERRQ